MAIEAIFLDVGGVLWLPKGPPLREKWAARCGLDPAEFDRFVYQSHWSEQAMAGTISSEVMWAGIGKALALHGDDLRALQADYWAGEWNNALLDLLRALKPRYKLGIISNADSSAREAVKPWVNETLFDVIVFSAEARVRKPDARIFRIALERMGVAAEASIFVDDRVENVDGARRLGLHGIEYQGLATLLDAFGVLGV